MFYQFLPMSKFKINWIQVVFAGKFTSALSKPSSFKKNLDTFHQPIKCQDKRKEYWPIRLLLLSLLLKFNVKQTIETRWDLLCFDNCPISGLFSVPV